MQFSFFENVQSINACKDMKTKPIENKISKDRNVLVVLQNDSEIDSEIRYLINNFCGMVVSSFSQIKPGLSSKRVYVCGDLAKLKDNNINIRIIKELSANYENCDKENIQIVSFGQVPIIISNAGVYFRKLFDGDEYFSKIKSEHSFQELTESTKNTKALRKGIYLTKVAKEENNNQGEILHFRLLRCSSNLTGPTDNFRTTDYKIINLLNDSVKYIFENQTELNHVLAQIYENKKKTDITEKETKSKIKAHSDKTKDMPKDGLIAFCTFYDKTNIEKLKPSNTDRYDLCYNDVSGLTRLHFKLKTSVSDDSLEKEFSVTLYPNSAFLIPLSTNRLYTHEIRPSILNVDRIPIRMGYVVRCSNLEAVHLNNQTFIKEYGKLIKLEKMTPASQDDLRTFYRQENISENLVEYGKIHFSMNSGDYEKPIY